MIWIIAANIVATCLAALLGNEFLVWNSYLFFMFQAATMLPFLFARAVHLRNVFLPSLFALLYLLVNLSVGGYLTPRAFGFFKEYAPTLLAIENYNIIVPYLMLSNLVLFVLTSVALRKLAIPAPRDLWLRMEAIRRSGGWKGIALTPLFFGVFVVVSNLPLVSVFPLQLGTMIVHLTNPSVRRSRLRYAAYAFYLAALVAFTFENKREIAIALFLMVLVESFYSGRRLNLSVRSIATYALAGVAFFSMVMTASIMRGYGGFHAAGVLDAVSFVPRYISSDIFVDAITDNLELNYNYGAAVYSIDLVLTNRIDYQLGATISKVLFLPIPRELFPAKPESIMQIYTQAYSQRFWDEGGSLPVILPSEMFVNFHVFGLAAYAAVWAMINGAFIRLRQIEPESFIFFSFIFLSVMVLALARGSGLELYVLYYLLATPVFAVSAVAYRRVRVSVNRVEPGVMQ